MSMQPQLTLIDGTCVLHIGYQSKQSSRSHGPFIYIALMLLFLGRISTPEDTNGFIHSRETRSG